MLFRSAPHALVRGRPAQAHTMPTGRATLGLKRRLLVTLEGKTREGGWRTRGRTAPLEKRVLRFSLSCHSSPFIAILVLEPWRPSGMAPCRHAGLEAWRHARDPVDPVS